MSDFLDRGGAADLDEIADQSSTEGGATTTVVRPQHQPLLPTFERVISRLRAALPRTLELEERNPLRFSIVNSTFDEPAYGGRIKRDRGTISVGQDGVVKLRIDIPDFDFELTEAEKDGVKAEVKAAKAKGVLHNSVPFSKAFAEDLCAQIKNENGGTDPTLFVYLDPTGKFGLFIQHRKFNKNGEKLGDFPWTYWSDGRWRKCEPSELLPLYGLERLNTSNLIMIHEGAKTADFLHRMLNGDGPEAERWRAEHPLADDLKDFAHLGWPGGANNPGRVDWSPIRNLPEGDKVILVCDNDEIGKSAAPKVSALLMRAMDVVMFDDRFPESFDLADEWPQVEAWRSGERYCGPTIEDLSTSATWATKQFRGDKGRPSHQITPQFAAEWLMITEPETIVNRRHPDRMLGKDQFNTKVRPYSHVDDTARFLAGVASSKVDGVAYLPGQQSGVILHEGRRVLNTWRPSRIRAVQGDPTPFLEFMQHLIPTEEDRYEVLRWSATLIARPNIKMSYGVLLMSETQGVGKGTLGEKILAPLAGKDNVSFPSETDIVDSNFNYWAAHKRLAVVHEIYQGHSWAYNKLKSLITDLYLTVRKKYLAEYTVDNFLHVLELEQAHHAGAAGSAMARASSH